MDAILSPRSNYFEYERLGEQVANELVDWFNAVDATYRGDLRELNEVNFTRFGARLERRSGKQTQWLVAAWVALLASVVGLWIRR